MALKLENVIRPFQDGDVFTATALPPVTPDNEPKPPITVLYGNPVNLQLKGIGITNLYGGAKLTEVGRTTKTVRVSNPTDPSQFVDVEKILTMKFKDAGDQEHFFNFDATK